MQFGGFSRLASVRGTWAFEGRTYRDTSRQYIVALNSWTQLPAWLDIARQISTLFQQEALYIEVAGVPEILITR